MSTSGIELIHFEGCPHVDDARENLRAALAETGRPSEWTEWDVNDDATPEDRTGFPSPTVLVAGEPVDGEGLADGASGCRAGGAPSTRSIRLALEEAG